MPLERALYDFAEAALGRNSEMQWSLSEPIARRQLGPLFDKCLAGELSAEQSLDVCVDCVAAKLHNNMQVLSNLYAALNRELKPFEPAEPFASHLELEEYFVGLNDEANWATSVEIARSELRPLFQRCSQGTVGKDLAMDLFCDHIRVKRDTFLVILQEIVQRLAVQLKALDTVGSDG